MIPPDTPSQRPLRDATDLLDHAGQPSLDPDIITFEEWRDNLPIEELSILLTGCREMQITLRELFDHATTPGA